MFGRVITACIALGLAFQCSAQSTITVKMGVAGNFFDPPTISALQGDTVTFLFEDMTHGVTQSSFEDPCLPLPGGFNSGLAGPGTNKSAPASSWSIEITNDTVPIYFFCQATRPLSHCGAGMVGAINPPSLDAFRTFLAAAKDVSATPTPTIQTILNGVGAFATAPPTQLPLDDDGLTTIFVTTTAEPSSTDSASSGAGTSGNSSSPNRGLLIGVALAGGIAVGVIAALAFVLIRTKMRGSQRKETMARTPWRSEQGGGGMGGIGFMSGKGKYMADPDKEEPDPFALRETSFISGEGMGDRITSQAWSGERGTRTAVNSPLGTSFPLMVMSPNTPAGFAQGGSGRGNNISEALSIASASTSSRGGSNQLQGSNNRGGLGHTSSYSSAGMEATLSGDHVVGGDTISHPLALTHANVGAATAHHSEGVRSPFSESAAVPLTPPAPVALVHQSTGSSSALGSLRHQDVNYQELAREVASLLNSQAQAGSPPMSPSLQGLSQQAQTPAQPQPTHLTEKQRLQQHLDHLSALPEEQQYATFPNPYSRDGSQISSPHRQPRQLPRPLPLIARNISTDKRNSAADEDEVASSRVTIAESEPPEYVRSVI